MFLRSFYLPAAFNFERYQALGYCYTILPVLKKLYRGRPKELKAAVKRNLEVFMTHPFTVSLTLGPALAMEESLARGEDMTPESISSFKVATMGPVAAISDSLFWMTLRPVIFGIGVSLAQATGSVLGAIVALILFNIPHIWAQWYPLTKGYELGISWFASMRGRLQQLTQALGVVAMMVLGTMTATTVKLSLKATINLAGASIAIQPILDSILPNLLPLALTFGCYSLFKKGVKPVTVLIGILLLGILGTAAQILG